MSIGRPADLSVAQELILTESETEPPIDIFIGKNAGQWFEALGRYPMDKI